MPLVSVVVPTHNRPDMLAEALMSVRLQTFRDHEVIVVSVGESNEMRALSRACAARYGCGTVYELPEGNLSAARDFAVERAKGKWIAFLDDGDIWLPHKLERQFAEAERAGADMIACNCICVFPDGREVRERLRPPEGWTYPRAVGHDRWGACPSAGLVRRSVLMNVGSSDSSCERRRGQ
jgi:glycosyltransferase involved in cell wall biosynthesis